jgi:hypothetical protein
MYSSMAMVYEYNVVAGYAEAIIIYEENTKLYLIKLILIPLKEGINNIGIVKVNPV